MQGIMSGLEPTPQRNEEEVLKQMLEDRAVLELEDRLGIKIPRSTDESEENLINKVLQITRKPISKKGDEFSYGKDDGLSFYINPKINGAGIRYNKKFADGGIAAFADGGFPDLSGDGKVTQKDILMGRGVIEKADGGIAVYANGGEAGTKYFGEDGLLFDPTNPLDYIMAVPGVGLAGAGIKALMVGNRLRKAKKALEPVAKLSNPTTNVAGLTALGVDLGTDPEIQDMFKSQSYSEMYEPGVAYEYEGGYFEYDPNDDEIYVLDDIPEGYRIEK